MALDKFTETFLLHIAENVVEGDLTQSIINIKSQLAYTPEAEIARALCYLTLELKKFKKAVVSL